MGEQKSILLLGGSRQQVIAIETAKRLGYRTVLCDYLPDNPGQYVADVFYQESTTDREKMLEIARAEGVSGVLAYASDPAALTCAYVAEQLGLPTNPLSSVETLSVKHLFRRHLAEHGFPCPKAVAVSADGPAAEVLAASEGMRLPVVLKPTDSSGSKGVTVLEARDEAAFAQALAHAASFSRNRVLVLEEYIRAGFPRVIGGDVFVAGGEVRFWGLMSCLRDEGLGGLVPVGERYPSGLSAEQLAAVREQIQALVKSLDLRFGELNVEVIVGEDGLPYFLELGARAGGNMIPVQLSDLSGIDLVEANVRYAMGDENISVDFSASDQVICTYVPHAECDGAFEGLAVAPELAPHLYRTVMYVEPGAQVERFDGANKAIGILFLRFDSVAQMEELLARMPELLQVRVA
jgi:biotin carboxylase